MSDTSNKEIILAEGVSPAMIFAENPGCCIVEDETTRTIVNNGCAECKDLDNRGERSEESPIGYTACACGCHS